MGTLSVKVAYDFIDSNPFSKPTTVFSADRIRFISNSSCTSFGYFKNNSIWWMRCFKTQVAKELIIDIGILILYLDLEF
jgi:hypothetical protein